MSIGILAFGSLIDDPGAALTRATIARKSVKTPFSVEFAHSSITRDGAPTLVPVSDHGLPVGAVLLVLDDSVTEPAARAMLYRRETGLDIEPDAVSRINWIVKLENFEGINICLYTAFPADIRPLDAGKLADLAVQSAAARAGACRRDGISYLLQQKSRKINTPLMSGYEKAVLARTGARDLAGAWERARSGAVAAKPDATKPDLRQADTAATEADGIKAGATATQSDGAGTHDDAVHGKGKRDQKPMEASAGDGNRWLVPSWVASVRSTADRLAGELDQTGCADPPPDYATIHQIVEEAIKRGRRHAQRHCLIVRSGPFRRLRSLWRRVADWWTGGEVNQAWAELHIASQALLTIQAPAAVKSQLADMAATVMTTLDPEDVRRKD